MLFSIIMDKKEIQEQRIRGYFIAATRDILKSEGLKSLSVRNIADRAGYSFATLYNYFRDLEALVSVCIKDFQAECSEYIQAKTAKQAPGIKKLKAVLLAYLEYFVQYPGVFELFFLEKLASTEGKQHTNTLIVSFLDQLCAVEWQYCISKKIYTAAACHHKRTALLYGTTGMLVIYLNRHTPSTYNSFLKMADHYIDSQLKA